jgi:hypothetical protein
LGRIINAENSFESKKMIKIQKWRSKKMIIQNKLLSLVLASTLGLTFPLTALAEQCKLEQGTALRLTLLDGVSSGRNKEGESVRFQVMDDVLASDEKTVLIKAGAPAWGTITLLQEHGMIGRKGEVSLSVEGAKAVDGKKVPLRANINRQGSSSLGAVVALSVIVTPLFLLMKGKDARLSAGVPLTAYVDKDVLVEVKTDTPITAAAVSEGAAMALTSTNAYPKAVPSYLSKYVDQGDQASTLKALEQLRAQGVLTQAEFDVKKQALLVNKK